MLLFSLDEYGDFENASGQNGPVFIGGLIFDDGGIEGEEERERSRIAAYYRGIISSCGNGNSKFTYPSALHVNRRSNNGSVVGKVKSAVSASLPEFIRYGTYEGGGLAGDGKQLEERRGKYHIFVILKSDDGISPLFSAEASDFVREDYACNLYFHMASQFVSGVVFHNPLLDIKNNALKFNLATRASADISIDSEEFDEYNSIGLTQSGVKGSYTYYQITDPGIYRTLIADEMVDSELYDVDIKPLEIRSINYNNPSGMEFLYMADSICSYLSFVVPGRNSSEWLNEIKTRLDKVTDSPILFAYDEADRIFANAWKAYENGHIYRSLCLMYKCTTVRNAFSRHYQNFWLPFLKERITSGGFSADIRSAIDSLSDSMRTNSADNKRALYIFGILEETVSKADMSELHSYEKAMLFRLYDTAVSVYSHIGDTANTELYYRKAREYSDYADNEQYMSMQNRLVDFLCDIFEYEKALVKAEENVEKQLKISDIRGNTRLNVPLGKSLSQRGQVCAYMRDTRAEEDFVNALDCFEQGSPNYMITLSYLLHYYLDNRYDGKYLEMSAEYFGGSRDIAGQLDYIKKTEGSGTVSLRFSFYVLVRGLYSVRLSEIDDDIWKRLCGDAEEYGITEHPCELIYKYLALIAISRGDMNAEREYEKKCERFPLSPGDAVHIIRSYACYEISRARGTSANRYIEEIKRLMKPGKAADEEALKRMLTYMYI